MWVLLLGPTVGRLLAEAAHSRWSTAAATATLPDTAAVHNNKSGLRATIADRAA
jgi:hypothetical protein